MKSLKVGYEKYPYEVYTTGCYPFKLILLLRKLVPKNEWVNRVVKWDWVKTWLTKFLGWWYSKYIKH